LEFTKVLNKTVRVKARAIPFIFQPEIPAQKRWSAKNPVILECRRRRRERFNGRTARPATSV